MLQGLYGAATTMQGAARQHEMIAKNLAHAQVPGYRRAQVVQGTFGEQLETDSPSNSGIRGVDVIHNFSEGLIEETGRPLDVAIRGQGFFTILEDGEELYTRNGSFKLNPQGQLVTRDDRVVQGRGGVIQLEEPNQPALLLIDNQGRVTANGTLIGQLKIVEFEEPELLVNVGTTLFQDTEKAAKQIDAPEVVSGHLEKANVHPVQELVDLIATQRRYETASRSMKLLMRSLEQHINLQGGR